MMNANSSRIQTTSDFCKSHSARSDREPCRISPSKLSKKELEDQYYILLENNIALKKMVNSQSDQARLMSAKVNRLTAAMKSHGQGNSCCAGVRAVVEEQKECIADLKRSNEKMSEKIKLLNMRLCSAKQFLKKSPFQSSRCLKCSRAGLNKNSTSVSAIHAKRSDATIQTTAVSCQFFDNIELSSPKSVRTEISQKYNASYCCEDNKCKTEMESLKKEIADLKEKLKNVQKEYTDNIEAMELEVSRMQAENTRTRAERNSREDSAREKEDLCRTLSAKLREVEARCNDVTMQLSLENKKVLELETRLRAAQLTGQLAKTVEEHLSNEIQKRNLSPVRTRVDIKCHSCSKSLKSSRLKTAMDEKVQNSVDLTKESKCSDDSGFTDPNRSAEKNNGLSLDKINADLINRISSLQSQLDELKVSTIKQLEYQEPNLQEIRGQSNEIISFVEEIEEKMNNDNISKNSFENSPSKSSSNKSYLKPKMSENDIIKTANTPSTSTPKFKKIAEEIVSRNRLSVEKKSFEKHETDDNFIVRNNDELNLSKAKETPNVISENDTNAVDTSLSQHKKSYIDDVKGPQTYSINKSEDAPKLVKSENVTTLDNTEDDISSISDCSGSDSSSAGQPSVFSQSYTVTSSALSEGELPRGMKILSIGERPVRVKHVSPFKNPQEPIAKKMESTLEAISVELSRCTRLLNTRNIRRIQT